MAWRKASRHKRGCQDVAIVEHDIAGFLQAWNNHAGYANTVGLRKRLFSQLPAEIIRLMQHLDTDQKIV